MLEAGVVKSTSDVDAELAKAWGERRGWLRLGLGCSERRGRLGRCKAGLELRVGLGAES